jgi:hypothetical protein
LIQNLELQIKECNYYIIFNLNIKINLKKYFSFSGGPLAKFSRRYGESPPMEFFNSSEIGKNLAFSVLGFF